jgi:superfamily II DNA or RNA helicase
MTTTVAEPEVGQLVRVRGQQWLVSRLRRSMQPVDELSATTLPGRTLVTLTNVSDDLGESMSVVWEVEPGREVVAATQLPSVTAEGWDDPQELGAFLDAVRWGTVASADTRTLQSPFRSGITIEEYQLEPVARALAMPRVNLLVADDVGLGKTIEAGLVAQELLLRHRARRIVVVCPASLTLKWRDEMAEKFGLEFAVLDAAALRELRRSHGLQANPFTVHPRTIISLQWLRTPRVQRLLDEVLTPDTRHPGFFDLMIVDEVHHCARPAPRRGDAYAVDSKQTSAVRRLGEHTHHRLFLSATPHNGHRESWWALLEMLDPQRFTRGVAPDPAAVAQVMVRRTKDSIVDDAGNPRFPGRSVREIEVAYTDDERFGHDLLGRYLAARRRATATDRVRADDLVALLLKKRLFSSPRAFARTLAAHADTAPTHAGGTPLPDWLTDAIGWDDDLVDDETGDEGERALLATISPDGEVEPEAQSLLDELLTWSRRVADPADSKAQALVQELRTIRDGDRDDRVIVFTEYVDTLHWLADLLDSRGLGGDQLGLLHGGMDGRRREHLKAAFQAAPDRDAVRILLATDAAGEGIDLQRHCHRVIHYDIPFNPNRLEQRIGRVDRHGQRHRVEVSHFVGAGWREASANSYEADLEFLSRVARKVAIEREDLGAVNPVLARGVEAQMLGRPVLVDPTSVRPSPSVAMLAAEKDLREQVRRLRHQLDHSVERLHVAPANVRRVVNAALRLAEQPPLADLGDGLIEPPALRAGWQDTVAGLADPLSGEPRPMTFDAAVSASRDDVVLAHLEHPLVAQCTRLLRTGIWGDLAALRRVTAVRAALPPEAGVEGLLLAVFARLVVVGADGSRLHEEVMLTGRALPDSGRSRRLELEQPRMSGLRSAVEASLQPDGCRPAPQATRHRVAEQWDRLEPLLAEDVRVRASERSSSLAGELGRRAEQEETRVRAVFAQLDATLRDALADDGQLRLRFEGLDEVERGQLERDRAAWQARLDGLEEERNRELETVRSRYAGLRELVFPIAVAVVVPDGDAR